MKHRTAFCAGILALAIAAPTLAAGPRTGATVYYENCTNCHGDDGKGPRTIDFEGPALVGNEFVKGQDDKELAEFLRTGRPADDPANMLRLEMPAFKLMSDADMKLLVQYVHKLAESN